MAGPGLKEGYVRDIWLRLCKEGGRWSPDEVATFVPITSQKAARVMQNMATRGGQLTRYKVNNRAMFGVTQDCAIPFGITVRELAEAGVLPAQ